MKKSLFLALCLATATTFAQKLSVEKGDFDFLKGLKEVNVVFVYDNMTLLKKNITNEQYVAEQKKEQEEKSPGKGDVWEKKWKTAPELIWQPKFLELMNRYFHNDHGLEFKEGLVDAPITLIVETVWLYPGWDAGVMKQPAKVTTVLRFVESTDPTRVLAETRSKDAPGDQWGSSFSNEDRLGEGYAKTGKSFAKLILKKSF